MIDIQTEKLLTLAEATRMFPGRVSVATLWRWRTKGVRGRILESVALGTKIYTSVEALARFAHSASGGPAPSRTSRQREAEIRAAERELGEDGI